MSEKNRFRTKIIRIRHRSGSRGNDSKPPHVKTTPPTAKLVDDDRETVEAVTNRMTSLARDVTSEPLTTSRPVADAPSCRVAGDGAATAAGGAEANSLQLNQEVGKFSQGWGFPFFPPPPLH